jgi:hypothetical protein
MPKLDTKTATAVSSAEPLGEFEPLAPGKYLAKLAKVDIRDNKNKYDLVMWNAEFEQLHTLDGKRVPGRQWLTLTLPGTDTPHGAYTNGADKWLSYMNVLRGRLASFFEAFGYSPDSDTDEMVGEWALLTIGVETIQAGTKAGMKTNRVNDVAPVPEGVDLADAGDSDTF